MASVNLPKTEGMEKGVVIGMVLAIFTLALGLAVYPFRELATEVKPLIARVSDLSDQVQEDRRHLNRLEQSQVDPPKLQQPQLPQPLLGPPIPAGQVVERSVGPLSGSIQPTAQPRIILASCSTRDPKVYRALSRRVKTLEKELARARSDLQKTQAEIERMRRDRPQPVVLLNESPT